jgi:DNA (cytosine-5)-methyltransferase 1
MVRRARDVAARAFNVLSLFSGIGGLDLGIALALGRARTVCYVEREAFAASALVARMADEALDSAPVWDDVCTFDARPWRGVVDCVAGGFPCQDVSLAGTGAGLDGERSGLWREYARIIDECRPGFVFIENVAALVRRGLDRVLGDLARLGFDAEWGVFSASDVGAPHRRERLFLLARVADADDAGLQGLAGTGRADQRHAWPGSPRVDAGNDGRCASSQGGAAQFDACAGAVWPPGPDDARAWARVIERHPELAPATEPCLRRVAHGDADRVDRLHALGNGVVPLAAAHALRALAARRRW